MDRNQLLDLASLSPQGATNCEVSPYHFNDRLQALIVTIESLPLIIFIENLQFYSTFNIENVCPLNLVNKWIPQFPKNLKNGIFPFWPINSTFLGDPRYTGDNTILGFQKYNKFVIRF